MSCLSINCRGLGGDATVKEIRDLAKEHAPIVLCIQETQLPKNRVEALAHSLGFDSSFAISSSGRSGGLAFF
jgi:exonuclease III